MDVTALNIMVFWHTRVHRFTLEYHTHTHTRTPQLFHGNSAKEKHSTPQKTTSCKKNKHLGASVSTEISTEKSHLASGHRNHSVHEFVMFVYCDKTVSGVDLQLGRHQKTRVDLFLLFVFPWFLLHSTCFSYSEGNYKWSNGFDVSVCIVKHKCSDNIIIRNPSETDRRGRILSPDATSLTRWPSRLERSVGPSGWKEILGLTQVSYKASFWQ